MGGLFWCATALAGVSRDSKKKILWDNCRRLYGFDVDG